MLWIEYVTWRLGESLETMSTVSLNKAITRGKLKKDVFGKIYLKFSLSLKLIKKQRIDQIITSSKQQTVSFNTNENKICIFFLNMDSWAKTISKRTFAKN